MPGEPHPPRLRAPQACGTAAGVRPVTDPSFRPRVFPAAADICTDCAVTIPAPGLTLSMEIWLLLPMALAAAAVLMRPALRRAFGTAATAPQNRPAAGEQSTAASITAEVAPQSEAEAKDAPAPSRALEPHEIFAMLRQVELGPRGPGFAIALIGPPTSVAAVLLRTVDAGAHWTPVALGG